jgi:hypothetical protein
MRLLFSSFHRRLVDEMGKRLVGAGITCEVRYRPIVSGDYKSSNYRELWIELDNNPQWAYSLLAMHCAVGRN